MTTTASHETPAQRRRRIKKSNRAEGVLALREPAEQTEQPNRLATKYALDILAGLQNRHVYGGTVADAVKQQRRTRTRAASKARRTGRVSA